MNRTLPLLLLSLLACGSVAAVPETPVVEAPAASASTALMVVTVGGVARVARVDARNASFEPVSAPLPAGFVPSWFQSSTAHDRFVVSGTQDGKGIAYAGTHDAWHVLSALDERSSVTRMAPSLDLIAIEGYDTVGRAAGARILRFDGSLVSDLGSSLEPVHVGDGGFVAVEYEINRVDDEGFVRTSRDKQPWWIYDAKGTRVRLADDRGPYEPAYGVEGGFAVVQDSTCTAFRWGETAPTTTYGCDDVAPPLVFDGDNAYRARADGRELFASVPKVDGVLAELDPQGVSVFVGLRDSDHTQVMTFGSASGARVTYDPPAEPDRDLDPMWTRATSRGGFACAVAERIHCTKGWSGLCRESVVDIVCSDGASQRSRRVERTYDEKGNIASGGEQFVITDDAQYVLWTESGHLHRLDARTFEEASLSSPATFGPREGAIPNVFNRPSP